MRDIDVVFRMLTLGLVLAIVFAACAKASPTVNPTTFKVEQATAVLDVLQASAVAANASSPKLLSDANFTIVNNVVVAAKSTIVQVPNGWKPSVLAALEQLQTTIPAAEYAPIAKYVAAAEIVIQLVA